MHNPTACGVSVCRLGAGLFDGSAGIFGASMAEAAWSFQMAEGLCELLWLGTWDGSGRGRVAVASVYRFLFVSGQAALLGFEARPGMDHIIRMRGLHHDLKHQSARAIKRRPQQKTRKPELRLRASSTGLTWAYFGYYLRGR